MLEIPPRLAADALITADKGRVSGPGMDENHLEPLWMYEPSRPSEATRPAFLSAEASPFLRRACTAPPLLSSQIRFYLVLPLLLPLLLPTVFQPHHRCCKCLATDCLECGNLGHTIHKKDSPQADALAHRLAKNSLQTINCAAD